MKYLVIEIACQSSSFRNPDFQNFHKSYDLPPPTTVFGMAGAALGISPKKTQEFFDEGFEIGISGYSNGKANDLWKFKNRDTPKAGNNYQYFGSSVLTREILFDNHFLIVFGHSEDEKLEKLNEAFNNPFYALSLGRSDELVKVFKLQEVSNTIYCDLLQNCIAEGNLLKEALDNPNEYDFALKEGNDPVSYEVPIAFEYSSEYGVRKVVKRKELSFLSSSTYVKGLKRKGIAYKNYQIPTFSLYD